MRVALNTLVLSLAFSCSRGAVAGNHHPANLPKELIGLDSVHLARMIAVGWEELKASPEDANEDRRVLVTGFLFVPRRTVSLGRSLQDLVQKPEEFHSSVHPAPKGYFIAYGKANSVWLITLERQKDFLTIARLRPAITDAEVRDVHLYWEDPSEPVSKCRSQILHQLFEKSEAKMLKRKAF